MLSQELSNNIRQMMPKEAMPYSMVYPEVYYRLHPYIMMVADEMDSYNMMPTQEMVESLTDSIYDDVRRMNPDMEKYMGDMKMQDVGDPAVDPDHFRRRFRRRGPFRDLIDILLLQELLGRRRRRFPFMMY